MADDFNKFQSTFIEGRLAVQRASEGLTPERRQDDDAVHEVVKGQWSQLRGTNFFATMWRDIDLQDLERGLASGMSTWIAAWARPKKGDVRPPREEVNHLLRWADLECFRDERRLAFWGRLGSMLHHYRDTGHSLSTQFERAQRTTISEYAEQLQVALAALAADPLVSTMYRTGTLADMERTTRLCAKLRTDLASSPLEVDVGANPFHKSSGLIRSQALLAFGLMAVELYGHVTPTALDKLLNIKSGTAEQLGLIPWGRKTDSDVHGKAREQTSTRPSAKAAAAVKARTPEGERTEVSKDAELRATADAILKRALALGERRQWITLPLAQFYAANPTLRRELDGDERDRHMQGKVTDVIASLFGGGRSRTPPP